MTEDERLKSMLNLWQVSPPSNTAQERMIDLAMTQQQRRPWTYQIEQALTDWRYGLTYKIAAAAACLVLGLGAGLISSPPASDVAGLALMSDAGSGL